MKTNKLYEKNNAIIDKYIDKLIEKYKDQIDEKEVTNLINEVYAQQLEKHKNNFIVKQKQQKRRREIALKNRRNGLKSRKSK